MLQFGNVMNALSEHLVLLVAWCTYQFIIFTSVRTADRRFRVFENSCWAESVDIREREEVRGGWIKSRSEDLHYLYF
jgi:hypothetical protein